MGRDGGEKFEKEKKNIIKKNKESFYKKDLSLMQSVVKEKRWILV